MRKYLMLTLCSLPILFHTINAQSLLNFTVYQNKENLHNIQSIQLDNGLTLKKIEPTSVNGEIKIEEQYFSPLAHVTINFKYDIAEFFVDSTVTYINVIAKSDNESNDFEYQGDGHFRRIDDQSTNAILSEWNEYKPELSKEFDRITKAHWGELRTNDSIESLFKDAFKESNERLFYISQKHPNDYFSFWKYKQIVLFTTSMIPEDKEYVRHLNSFMENVFPPAFRYTPEGQSISEMLHAYKRKLEVNDIPPSIDLETINKERLQVGHTSEKLILLDFWATWCPPCVAQLPKIDQLFKKYDRAKIDVIGISADHSESALTNYINRNNFRWPQVHDSEAEISKKFQVSVYPTLFLLDHNGEILYKKEGSGSLDELDNIISKHIRF